MTPALDESGNGTRWLVGETDLDEVVEVVVAGGEAAGSTRVGPGDGRKNEDSAAIVATGPTSALLAVADGFGGAPSGERASSLAAAALAEAVLAARDGGKSQRAAILDGFEAANHAILDLGIGAATTLAAVSIEDGLARPFHSGDSAILVVGGRGKIKWETVAHSPAGYAVASGWVGEDEAREHEESQVVSNYLGSQQMGIEVGPKIHLSKRDIVLVASDGLADNLPIGEIVQVLLESPSLAVAVAELTARARAAMATEAGKPDDCTIIAYRPTPRAAIGDRLNRLAGPV